MAGNRLAQGPGAACRWRVCPWAFIWALVPVGAVLAQAPLDTRVPAQDVTALTPGGGRAFFEQALPASASFEEAFGKARALIESWEERDRQDAVAALEAPAAAGVAAEQAGAGAAGEDGDDGHSLAQMLDPPAMRDHLALWWAQTVAPRAGAARP